MSQHTKYYYVLAIFAIPLLMLQTTGCYKEYSIEGKDSTTVIKDSIIPIPAASNEFPDCTLCKESDELTLATWNFKTGNSYLCGSADNAGFVGGNTFFTFFGPSACSIDTGMVLSVHLPVPFDQDRFDVLTSNTAFYYYDHHAPKDIFISLPPTPFWVNIESYIYSTGIVTGTFSGIVYKPNDDTAFISNGKFKVKLK